MEVEKLNNINMFVAFDIETTGLSPTYNQIIEIAAIKYENGKRVDSFHSLINPGIPIPNKITQITGITTTMLKDAPGIQQVLPSFLEFIGDYPLVAHNSSFDMSFIKNKAAKLNITVDNQVIDTLRISRKTFPALHNHKLNTVCQHLNIALIEHHRAMADSAATAEIFLKCSNLSK